VARIHRQEWWQRTFGKGPAQYRHVGELVSKPIPGSIFEADLSVSMDKADRRAMILLVSGSLIAQIGLRSHNKVKLGSPGETAGWDMVAHIASAGLCGQ